MSKGDFEVLLLEIFLGLGLSKVKESWTCKNKADVAFLFFFFSELPKYGLYLQRIPGPFVIQWIPQGYYSQMS